MSNNYEDYGYEEETKRSSGLGKKLLIVLLVVLAIILIHMKDIIAGHILHSGSAC